MASKRIDYDLLAVLLRDGLDTRQIADRLGVQDPAVLRACRRCGLPMPIRPLGPVKCKDAAPKVPTRFDVKAAAIAAHSGRNAALVGTGGRHADLSRFAKDWGCSETKARQDWFNLRLPLVVK